MSAPSPSDRPPIVEGVPPTDEQKRLVALFDEMEKKQIEFLDGAGKRIVELCTALLGVFFGVLAFGDKFPPPYLAGSRPAQVLTLGTLVFYVAAMLAGLYAVQPREYRRYQHNLTEMRRELQRIIGFKSKWVRVAGGLFFLGTVWLALLIVAIVLG